MGIPTQTSAIPVSPLVRVTMLLLCGQGLRTCSNQSHLQVSGQCFPFAGEGNAVLYLSGKQVLAVHTLHLSTPHPEYGLMFDAAPDCARVESISCLGLLDLREEDIRQGRGLQLSRKELENCFMVIDFHKHLGLILGVTVPSVIVCISTRRRQILLYQMFSTHLASIQLPIAQNE